MKMFIWENAYVTVWMYQSERVRDVRLMEYLSIWVDYDMNT